MFRLYAASFVLFFITASFNASCISLSKINLLLKKKKCLMVLQDKKKINFFIRYLMDKDADLMVSALTCISVHVIKLSKLYTLLTLLKNIS